MTKCKCCGQEIKTNPIQKIKAKTLEWGNTCEKELTWDEAKNWCKKQGKDWRLPTLVELLQAYEEKIEGFNSSNYWSATENSTTNAWVVYFSTGGSSSSNKDYIYSVRCVRGW